MQGVCFFEQMVETRFVPVGMTDRQRLREKYSLLRVVNLKKTHERNTSAAMEIIRWKKKVGKKKDICVINVKPGVLID